MSELSERIEKVRSCIGNGVVLVGATKTVQADVLAEAERAGLTIFGENRVQELLEKYPSFPHVSWHFIGHLQTNKVKYVVDKAELIHSVDTVKLAAEIERQAAKIGKVQDVLLEVNAAEEESKSGFFLPQVDEALEKIACFSHVKVRGLMGMVPKTENIENNVRYYLQMKEKYDTIQKSGKFDFAYLSMGMSDDYALAVQCGSNMVRVGSAIFGKRNYK